jgi:O-antigen/teichoic acid export membrane protein/glycosyltransferase involved in cell wall biosynthesis
MSANTATSEDRQFRGGLLLVSGGSLVNLALLFLELLIVARLLPTRSYGEYVLLVAAANFLVMICDFGCKLSVTQFISTGDHDQQSAVVSSALIFRCIVLIVVSALIGVVLFVSNATRWSTGLDAYLVYLPIMLITASFDELLFAMLQGFQAYRQMAAALLIRGVLRLSLTVVLLIVLHGSLVALVYSWSISFAVVIALQYLALPLRGVWRWHRETLLAVLRFGRSLQAMRFLGFISDRMHITLLGALAGVDSVAFFAVANRIPDALQTLSDSFVRVYFPAVSALLAAGRKQAAELMLQRSLRLLSFVSALGAVIAAAFSREIVTLLFSAKYAPAAPAFALLMVALQMTMIVNLLGYTLTATGRPARALWLDLGQAAALLLGDVLLIPFFGTVGAAAAALVGSYASGPIGVLMVRRSDLALDARPYARQSGIVLSCLALTVLIHPVGLLSALAFKGAVLAGFCIASLLLATIDRGDFGLVLGKRGAPAVAAEPVEPICFPVPIAGIERIAMNRKRICILAFKQVRQCVHVLRQIEYLAEDFDLTVVGYGEADANWPPTQWRSVPQPTLLSKAIKAFWFSLGRLTPRAYDAWYWSAKRHKLAYEYALASEADAFHANDWQSLPIAVRAARQTGARVVFHMHEYAEEERTDSFAWRFFVAPAVRYLVKKYTTNAAGAIDAYITVCEPIAERYARELGKEVEVVYNAPKPVRVLHTSADEGSARAIRLIHHGYAKRGRGLHKLIEALALSDERFRLHFMLVEDDAGYIDELRALAERIAPGRVRFRETVLPDEIVRTVAQYDIGFCVIEPSTYNNLMMLPNKLFEYIQAGLAVCVGPSPAMADLVAQYDVGVVAGSFEPADVAAALNRLTWAEIEAMKQAARQAASVLNADVEMGKVVTLYRRLLDDAGVVAVS